jgi:ABC-type Co2+ transport system permease subunit
MVTKIAGIALWVIATSMALAWAYGIRSYVKSGAGVTQMTVNTAMLFAVSVVVIPLTGISPFHLLWMFPVAWLLGTLSLLFPISLLSIPGLVFRAICCIGLGRKV